MTPRKGYLRRRVQLPVHDGPRAVVLQQTRRTAQTPPLQVDVLIWILLLCGNKVSVHDRSTAGNSLCKQAVSERGQMRPRGQRG